MSNSNPGSGGPPLRATAMVLISLSIVFAGLGAMSLSGADSESSDNTEGAGTTTMTTTVLAAPRAGTSAAAPTSAAAQSTSATASSTSAAPVATTTAAAGGEVDRSAPIRVLNNSMVAGLAATTASDLVARGWTNTSTGNYAAGTLAATTVYYGDAPGDRETAAAVAADIGATTAPMIPGLGDGSGVVVVVTGR